MVFNSPLQCNSTTLLPFNATSIVFTSESTRSILISNIQQLAPFATYQIFCRLRTSSNKVTTSIKPTMNIEVHHNYTIGNSYVATVNGVVLKQAPISPQLAKPVQFTISNPQIYSEKPKVNYVGPLFLDF